jgi:hypothetical protein
MTVGVLPRRRLLNDPAYPENAPMKILLVWPEFPETFWSFKYALKFIHKKASDPPLGLLTVAALLPGHWQKAGGYQCRSCTIRISDGRILFS